MKKNACEISIKKDTLSGNILQIFATVKFTNNQQLFTEVEVNSDGYREAAR